MRSSRAASLPLTGADCFLLAFDGEVRRWCGASHLSQLVLRLGPGLDPALLRKTLEELAVEAPILRAPVRRRGGLGPPVYRIDLARRAPAPSIKVHEAAGTQELPVPAPIMERLNDRLDARHGPLLRFDVVRYRDGSADLGMTWLHLLLDGTGSEHLLTWLDARARGEPRVPSASEEPPVPSAARRGARERGREATRWRASLRALAARPPRSLAGPLARTPQRLGYDVHAFTPEETARITERAAKRAGFLTPMLFYLAAALRAHHAVARQRGTRAASYVVPLPIDLRRKGSPGAIFRTHVSMLWFQVEPEQCEDFATLLSALKEQRRESIRARLVEAGAEAMDFARYLPSRAYARMARRDFAGELCSFFFAYTGAFAPELDRFLGAEIRDAFHTPSVPPSPGSSLVFCLRPSGLRALHIRQHGVFELDELSLFAAQLRSDLLAG
jgi:hypothetical protein